MPQSDKIIEVLDSWGLELVNDMRDAVDKYYKSGGGQSSALAGSVKYYTLNSGGKYTFALTMADYWKWANDGRKKGVKGVPLEVLGKQWQNKHNIDARKILLQYQKGLKKDKKRLNYDKAVKSLAFLIQRSIKKKGIEPRPFYDEVVTPERMNDLKVRLAKAIKDEFIVSFNKD